jgi:GAF domain-containing protein
MDYSKQITTQLAQPSPTKTTTNFILALTALLTLICVSTEWEYGESWIPDPSHPVLELSPAWSVNTNLDLYRATSWMQFQICSQEFVLGMGEGLPGRVWQSLQPEWIEDVSIASESYFLRHQIAKALNVRAGLALPIVKDNRVIAVVVLFMSKVRSPDTQLLATTQSAISKFQSHFPLI